MPRVHATGAGQALVVQAPAIDADVLAARLFLQSAASIPEEAWAEWMAEPLVHFWRTNVRGVLGDPDPTLAARVVADGFNNAARVVVCEEGAKDVGEWRMIGWYAAAGADASTSVPASEQAWFIYTASCCYTGWDCLSDMRCIVATGLDRFVQHALTDRERRQLAWQARWAGSRVDAACVRIQAHFRGWVCRRRTAFDPHHPLGDLLIRRRFAELSLPQPDQPLVWSVRNARLTQALQS